MATPARTVLVVDGDRDIARLVQALLTDEGYHVAVLHHTAPHLVVRTVGQLEPDCILLDGESSEGFGSSWQLAEAVAVRRRPVPVLMFTAHLGDIKEAHSLESVRSRAAQLSGVVRKPFSIEELLGAVGRAVGQSMPFDDSREGDVRRTQELVERLEAAGAYEVHPAARREWVTFRTPQGRTAQLYWWQTLGLYLCGIYDAESGRMLPIGEFPDRDVAITCILDSENPRC